MDVTLTLVPGDASIDIKHSPFTSALVPLQTLKHFELRIAQCIPYSIVLDLIHHATLACPSVPTSHPSSHLTIWTHNIPTSRFS